MLEKTTKFIMLYDFYQELLTEKQKQFAELYFEDDLSLSEIAEQFTISRQAVYEHIKRAEKLLEEYESKLQLLMKYSERTKVIHEMEELLQKGKDNPTYYSKINAKLTLLKRLE